MKSATRTVRRDDRGKSTARTSSRRSADGVLVLGAVATLFVTRTAYAQPDEDVVPNAPAEAASPPGLPSQAGSATNAPSSSPSLVEKKWYEAVSFGAFVDGYYSQNWRRPKLTAGANTYQPFTPNSGFNLAWVGLDASVEPDPVGAVLQLRFGPSVPNLALGDYLIPGGIGFVQNGYLSWKPAGKAGKLTLIVGKFDTIYGAEVAQSQLNFNYTRGILYDLAQPYFHTGLRGDIQLTGNVTLKLLAVNGWNDTIDTNRGKSFGAQVTATLAEGKSFTAGYMGGPEEPEVNSVVCRASEVFDAVRASCVPAPSGGVGGGTGSARNAGADTRWRHLVDVVGDVSVTKSLRVVANGDYVTQTISVAGQDRPVSWYGAATLVRYAVTDTWAVAARGEVVRDPHGQITAPNTRPVTLRSGTATLEYAPHKLLLIRLDNRIDASDVPIFRSGLGVDDKIQLTSILGVVAKTN